MASKNKITKKSCEVEEGIPEWLLIELLSRLPAASICRFKVVSKQWLSLILSRYFLSTYASRASPHPHLPPWTFLSQLHYYTFKSNPFSKQQLLMDLHSGGLRCPISNDQVEDQNIRMNDYKVFAVSSSGLILYRCSVEKNSKDGRVIYSNYNICNPITMQCISLPPCISGFVDANVWGFLTDVKGGVLQSYTLVVFFPQHSRFEVFFSETAKWEAYTVSTHLQIDYIFLYWTSIDMDGILHWISAIDGIVAYDPRRNPNSFRVIAFPTDGDNRQSHKDKIRMCDTYQGCLRYLESAALSLSVWVLKDYGCGDNWCLQHRVEYRDVNLDTKIRMNIEPISFHPLDSDIIYLGCDTAFVSYDMRAKTMQVVDTFKTPKEKSRRYQWCRAFTLMIPPLPVSIPSSLRLKYCHPRSYI